MTMELVTGHAGEPHVTAAQDAALHAGVIGGDDYVLSTKDRFAINVVSANKVTIAGGDLVMQGYHASNDKPADLIITNGSQGQKKKRHHLLPLHQSRRLHRIRQPRRCQRHTHNRNPG